MAGGAFANEQGPERPEPPALEPVLDVVRETMDLRAAVAGLQQNSRDAREEFKREVAGFDTKEARETAQQTFREAQRDRHFELRDKLKDLRRECKRRLKTGTEKRAD